MKKSQLKALIREVIEEVSSQQINFNNLESAGFKLANVGGHVMLQKGNLLAYYTGGPNEADKKWRVTTHIVRGDELPTVPYEKGEVKTMADILKWDKIINSKKP